MSSSSSSSVSSSSSSTSSSTTSSSTSFSQPPIILELEAAISNGELDSDVETSDGGFEFDATIDMEV